MDKKNPATSKKEVSKPKVIPASKEKPATVQKEQPKAPPKAPQVAPPNVKASPPAPTPEKKIQPSAPASTPKPVEKLSVQEQIDALKQMVLEHTRQIAELAEALARKRKPVASNGKVQIKDKKTGEIYPSKNNAYQTLLKSGELKDLIAKGVFGTEPAKNTFGWYALVRELPERFEEIHLETEKA